MSKYLLIPLSLIFLLISGCDSTPEKGEIYENKLTRERIKIDDVGQGQKLHDMYIGMNELLNEVIDDPGFRARMLKVPNLSPEDSSKQCVAYEEKVSVSAGLGKTWIFGGEDYGSSISVTVMKIIPVDELKEDYTKVD